jgi:beta-lactam-binding protein with PASTA domain
VSFADAVELRRTLMNLAEPSGPPPVPRRRQVEMPLLTGLPVYEAHAVLAASHLMLGSTTVVDSPLPSQTVVGQDPAPGTPVDTETRASLQVASGLSVRLPPVVGRRLSDALCELRSAGLRREPTVAGDVVPDAHVSAVEPPAGTLVTPETPVTVTLRLRHDARR